jgi:hypothetical protein
MALFNRTIKFLLLLLIILCLFDFPNILLIFVLKDIQLVTIVVRCLV